METAQHSFSIFCFSLILNSRRIQNPFSMGNTIGEPYSVLNYSNISCLINTGYLRSCVAFYNSSSSLSSTQIFIFSFFVCCGSYLMYTTITIFFTQTHRHSPGKNKIKIILFSSRTYFITHIQLKAKKYYVFRFYFSFSSLQNLFIWIRIIRLRLIINVLLQNINSQLTN